MEYTITIPDKLVPGLNKIVGRYNAEQGTDLTVAGWLQLHALEIAVGDQLAAEQQRLARQAEADVQAAVVAFRDRLTAADSEVNS